MVHPRRRFVYQKTKQCFLFLLALFVMLPGTLQAAPSETLVSATVDVIVAIDSTGSMSGWIQQVRSETTTFANQLQAEGFNYRLGLLNFKDISVDGGPWWYGFTGSAATFNSWVNGLSASGGGDWPESDINAMWTAQQKFVSEGRSTAGRMLIVITDAPFKSPESGYDVTSIGRLLNNNNIVLNIIGSGADAYGQVSSLDAQTRGQYYNTTDLRTAYQGIIAQIQRNTPPKVEESNVVLPPGIDPGSITTSTDLEFSLKGSDPDGDVLRYYWEALSPDERKMFLGDTPTIHVRLTQPGVWEVTGTATDPTGESVSVTHRIAVGNRKPSIGKLRLNSANTTTPTLFWDYSDPDGHPQEKINVRVKQGDTVVWNSGEQTQSIASATIQGMAYGQNYTVEARVMDQYDAWGDWASLSVHINQLPDLRPLSITTIPSESTLEQDTVTAKVQIKNDGEQAAGTFRVAVYDGSNLIGNQTVSSLNPGASTEASFSFKAATPGNHTLKAVVDAGGQISESNESNNEMLGTIQVLNRVDLVPSIAFLPAESVPQGGRFTVRVGVINQGQGTAGTFRVDVSQNGTVIAQKTIDHLDASATTTFDLPNLPVLAAGTMTFNVTADAGGQLAEAREDNNTVQSQVRVLAPQETSNLKWTTTPDGRSITVSWSDPTDAFFDHAEVALVPSGAAPGTPIRVEKGVKTYTFSELKPETAYAMQIQSVNSAGYASTGISQTITTPRDSVPPDEVTELAVTPVAAGKALTVTWKDPATYDFKQVGVAYRANSGEWKQTPPVGKGTEKVVLDNLLNGVPYDIKVYTEDIYGNLSSGKRITGTPKDVVPPDEVQNVRITSGKEGRSVEIKWNDPGDEDLQLVELRLLKPDGTPIGEPIRVKRGVEQAAFLHTAPSTDVMIELQTVDESGNMSVGIRKPFRTAADTIPPEAVRDLSTAADKSSGTIRLTWREPSDEGLQTIHLYLKGDQEEAEWTEAGQVPAGVQKAVLKPEANHRYQVRVVAADDQGNRSAPAETGVTLLPPKPLKPADVRYSKWGASQVIMWAESGNVLPVSFKLYRQMPGEEAKEIASVSADKTRYVDDSLTLADGQPVNYYVTAVDRDGTESDRSGPVGPTGSFTDSPIVRVIRSSAAEVGLESTRVNGAATYILERRETGDWQEQGRVSAGSSETMYWTDRNIEPGHGYQYRVIAESEGRRAISAPVQVTVPAAVPSQPGTVKAEWDGAQVRLSWAPPAEGADAYNIYRKTDIGSVLLLASRFTSGTVYTDHTVSTEHNYTYYVSAWKNGKESGKAASQPVRTTVSAPSGWGRPDDQAKDHVGDYVSVEQVGESVRISWRAAEGTPAHYFVYRQEAGSLYQKLIAVLTADRLQFVDSTPRLGATYKYAVQAQYRLSYGSTLTSKFEARPITVRPPDGILPSAVFEPDNVKATVDDGHSVLLTWDVPKAAKEYLIYRKGSGEAVSKLVGRVDGMKGALFSDTSATPGSTYVYEVIARYPGGNSETVKSNAVTIP